ncbi:MAG: hypothetical protein WCK16_04900, partial [Candidatus Moraniibacteriota bacterium]
MENKFPKSEAGIRYGVQLIKDKTLIDEKVYTDDVLSVESNNFIQKIFSYDAPSYLSGDFELWLVSENESGLPLATFKFEKPLTLSGTGEYLEINNKSCSLKIEGDKDNKIYSLMQGVSLKPEETLRLNCEVISHFKEAVTISPSYSTFERTIFGNLADKDRKVMEIVLQVGEKKTIDWKIEKPKVPQAYEVKLDLLKANLAVASPVIFHYVIAGESATIQKLDLDKISYQKGDIINATLRWFGSTDDLAGSRTGNTKDNAVLLGLDIFNDANQKCADSLEKTLEPNSPEAKLALTAKINCTDPKVKVTLKNRQGVILAQKEFNFLKNKEISPKQPEETAPTAKHKSSNSVIIIILILVLVVILILFFLKKRNKTGNLLLFLLLLGVLFSCRLQNVRAITISKPNNGWGHFSYSVNLNKGSGHYDTGEAMSVTYSGTASISTCHDGYSGGNTTLLAATNTSGTWGDFASSWRGNGSFVNGDCSVSSSGSEGLGKAPSNDGSISFRACISAEGSGGSRNDCSNSSSGGNFDSASGSISYTIASTTLSKPTCEIKFDNSTYNTGDSGKITWSSKYATQTWLICTLAGKNLINTSVTATGSGSMELASPGSVSCVFTVHNALPGSSSESASCSASATVTDACKATCGTKGSFCLDPAGISYARDITNDKDEKCCGGKHCYICNEGYRQEGSLCVLNTCQGTLPTNSEAYDSEESANLTNDNTSWSYASSDTDTKCEYGCKSGFERQGSSCVMVYVGCLPGCENSGSDVRACLDPVAVSSENHYKDVTTSDSATCCGTQRCYACADGYTFNIITRKCVKNPPDCLAKCATSGPDVRACLDPVAVSSENHY